jgi:hypothetical protein
VALQRLKEIFNKKSVRAAVLGAAVLGAGVGGYHYMTGDGDRAGTVSYGPPAVIVPFSVEPAKQEAALDEWQPDWRRICHMTAEAQDTLPAVRIQAVEDLLARMSEEELVGAQAVTALRSLGTAVCLNGHRNALQAAFVDATNVLTVKRELDPSWQLFHVIREARHAVQQTQGMRGSINTTREEAVRIAFALEADAVATTVLAASRLRRTGNVTLWNMLDHDTLYADLKSTFTLTMLNENDEMKAAQAVFSAWYTDTRRLQRVYDEVLVREQNEQRWPVERPYFEQVPYNFFDRLGELGDGRNYGAGQSPHLHRPPFRPGS